MKKISDLKSFQDNEISTGKVHCYYSDWLLSFPHSPNTCWETDLFIYRKKKKKKENKKKDSLDISSVSLIWSAQSITSM